MDLSAYFKMVFYIYIQVLRNIDIIDESCVYNFNYVKICYI